MNTRNLELRFKAVVILQIALLLFGLRHLGGRHWSNTPAEQLDWLRTYLIGVVGIYAVALLVRWERTYSLRGKGTPEPEVRLQSLLVFAGCNTLLAAFPGWATRHAGLAWAAPFYAFYLIYLLQVCLTWRRYRQSLAPAA